MIKHIYILTLLLILSDKYASARNEAMAEDNKIYKTSVVDIETTACAEMINKDEILEKEFADTKFSLDLQNNQIIIDRKNKSDSKILEYKLNNTKLIFKNQEEYGKIEAYLIYVNELPVLRFKDHSDDCFLFVVNFSK